ncbi:hypothetical protein FA95DRAFT_707092 [Auriscalpium vulgare]|uniref:Uncharacterized protein n=1 Tax=Auriscalpium vulgare TaxID=40419 RepID=A0ACB8S106_9AGAM|nr:hypothetical protein FA95DRAFT_707092 [Auriscalpium vulgare]
MASKPLGASRSRLGGSSVVPGVETTGALSSQARVPTPRTHRSAAWPFCTEILDMPSVATLNGACIQPLDKLLPSDSRRASSEDRVSSPWTRLSSLRNADACMQRQGVSLFASPARSPSGLPRPLLLHTRMGLHLPLASASRDRGYSLGVYEALRLDAIRGTAARNTASCACNLTECCLGCV